MRKATKARTEIVETEMIEVEATVHKQEEITAEESADELVDSDMLPVYDFSKGIRGKYVQRLAEGSNIIVLAPDLAEIFPDSAAVNDALRALADIAQRQVKTQKNQKQTNSELRR